MKTRILTLVTVLAVLSSCSTLYKTGQTPDDLYLAPTMAQNGNVSTERDRDRGYADDGYVDLNDRYLRMKSRSRRWSSFDDDFMYWNNPYWNNQFMFNSWNRPFGWNYGYGSMTFGSMWGNPMWMNPYWGMNSFPMTGFGGFYGSPFSPYYYGTPIVIISDTKPSNYNPRANGPRTFNLGSYNRNNYVDPQTGRQFSSTGQGSSRTGIRVFSNSSTGSDRSGGYISTERSTPRGGYNGNYNNNGGGSPSRTFEPSNGGYRGSNSVGTGSNSSGNSGSAPVRSFPRGGGN